MADEKLIPVPGWPVKTILPMSPPPVKVPTRGLGAVTKPITHNKSD